MTKSMMRRNAPYSYAEALHPARSMFDLSYPKMFTCDMGQLIPVMCDEVVPGDVFKIGCQAVIRFQPLVAPVMHEIHMYVHYFFVPYRLLWDDWEDFITGGDDGQFTAEIPRWGVAGWSVPLSGSLWDFMGFPLGVDTDGAYPMEFPKNAYNLIWNEYYRDETLQDEVDLSTNELILNRNWGKDYLTSALPWQQRGTAPALPISGTTHATWASGDIMPSSPANNSGYSATVNDNRLYVATTNGKNNALGFLNSNVVDFGSAITFDIADLRLAFQIQRFLERNARSGARYTEFLKAHFGHSPRDERLQRPEYIGGCKSPIIISEVLQTSESATTAQGNMAGHGITVAHEYCGTYHAEEFGLIMGIMSVMPVPAYSQGINKQWLRKTKYDFYFPEFANLSEQAVLNCEVCATATRVHNEGIFGYQGRYDEMRTKNAMFCSEMRSTFDYWHLGREFDVASPPSLNANFIKCVPRKDIFADQADPGLIVHFGNIIKAYRPLPIMPMPGLIDHD